MKRLKLILKSSALFVLIAVIALSVISCNKGTEEKDSGKITVTVEVIGKDGSSKEHIIKTDKTNLADALREAGIVEGEDGDYGFFITAVDGVTADFAVDKSYWAISKGGEYLMTGASATEIKDGDHFELTYTISDFEE